MSGRSTFRYLSRADVVSLGVTPADLLGPIRDVLVEKVRDCRVENPPKVGVHPRRCAAVHGASAYIPSRDLAGVKWIARYPQNPQHSGVPACDGLCILNEGATGAPLAVLDASWITETRTAVATAIALTAVRPGGVAEVTLLGGGAQGLSHLEALPQIVPGLSRVRIYSRRPDRVRAQLVNRRVPVEVIVVDDPQEALHDVPAVVSAIPMGQPARPPYDASHLAPGTAVVAIDFDAAWKPTIFDRVGMFVVDDVPQYRRFAEQGWFEDYPRDPVDLSEVLLGRVDVPQDELVYVNNLGIGVEDVVTAAVLLAAAEAADVGRLLEH